jgi:hypothetical protein
MNNKEIFIPFVDVYTDILRYAIIAVAFLLIVALNLKLQPANTIYGHFILFSAILVILISGKIPFQHSFLYINKDGITVKTAPLSIQSVEWSKISNVQLDKTNIIFIKSDNKKIYVPLSRIVMLDKDFAKEEIIQMIKNYTSLVVAA